MNVVSGEHSAERGQIPIALWTKDLITKRIRMEAEDIPSKEAMLANFPPHNMKNPAYIEQYHNYIYQFIENANNLRAMDAAHSLALEAKKNGEQDGEEEENGEQYERERKQDEENEEEQEEEEEQRERKSTKGKEEEEEEEDSEEEEEDEVYISEDSEEEDVDSEEDSEEEEQEQEERQEEQPNEEEQEEREKDNEEEQEKEKEKEHTEQDEEEQEREYVGHGGNEWETPICELIPNSSSNVLADTPTPKETKVVSTQPTKRRGNRPIKQSKSTRHPYVSQPAFKVQKMTKDKKKILDYLIRRPTKVMKE